MVPSMEGRTIVRPDRTSLRPHVAAAQSFNGGPDNRPARPHRWIYRVGRPVTLQWRAGQSSGQTPWTRITAPHPHPPSMEGRTIVRPDANQILRDAVRFICLQWRAGQSSGQTSIRSAPSPSGSRPSMEGRTIVRPDLSWSQRRRKRRRTFNGGPDNRPARPASAIPNSLAVVILQWRAGQSSGQTRRWGSHGEHRTPSFNGGPDNRPARPDGTTMWVADFDDLQWRAGQSSGQTSHVPTRSHPSSTPSMEGRTIVRPDRYRANDGRDGSEAFNGGPDNRPARLPWSIVGYSNGAVLQWRAGQSSGQTGHACGRGGRLVHAFNGGPDNRPARPGMVWVELAEMAGLQWRAGQSSGQTVGRAALPGVSSMPSMEGRTIVRPDQAWLDARPEATIPSMEGRTIVRPDSNGTATPDTSTPPFNGGPDNRPARPAPAMVRLRLSQPSMEGRTIVRPDLSVAVHPSAAVHPFNGGPDNRPARPGLFVSLSGLVSLPSMEGRTIVRPDPHPPPQRDASHSPFNGGPDNRPARPGVSPCITGGCAPFNGGPDNRPARLVGHHRTSTG